MSLHANQFGQSLSVNRGLPKRGMVILRASNSETHLRDAILSTQTAFSDTRILCSDGYISANRLLLASIFPLIAEALNDQLPGTDACIQVPDLSISLVRVMLDFVYTGHCVVPHSMHTDFIQGMEMLGFDATKSRLQVLLQPVPPPPAPGLNPSEIEPKRRGSGQAWWTCGLKYPVIGEPQGPDYLNHEVEKEIVDVDVDEPMDEMEEPKGATPDSPYSLVEELQGLDEDGMSMEAHNSPSGNVPDQDGLNNALDEEQEFGDLVEVEVVEHQEGIVSESPTIHIENVWTVVDISASPDGDPTPASPNAELWEPLSSSWPDPHVTPEEAGTTLGGDKRDTPNEPTELLRPIRATTTTNKTHRERETGTGVVRKNDLTLIINAPLANSTEPNQSQMTTNSKKSQERPVGMPYDDGDSSELSLRDDGTHAYSNQRKKLRPSEEHSGGGLVEGRDSLGDEFDDPDGVVVDLRDLDEEDDK